MRVAVVGAGVVGLAAASELMRAGAEVRCYEKAEAGSGQSKGRTRIFRLAHGDARLIRPGRAPGSQTALALHLRGPGGACATAPVLLDRRQRPGGRRLDLLLPAGGDSENDSWGPGV
ncbi:MAG: FAD-dependent oxidoreductase [Chloroflexi bacterium]|nr:FAD-dependent oxidoreductase [Chloroflexota bacterium]